MNEFQRTAIELAKSIKTQNRKTIIGEFEENKILVDRFLSPQHERVKDATQLQLTQSPRNKIPNKSFLAAATS